MRDRTLQNRITVALGILLTFAMGASLLLPLLSNFARQPQTVQPTNTPRPTVPPPITDLDSIDFSQTYLHPSGLFKAAIPRGWVKTNEFNTTGEAQLTMRNATQQSVVEIRVTRPTAEQDISTMEGVSEIFNEAWINSSWNQYSSRTEVGRTIEDDRIIIDFNLTQGGQDYIARQESFTDGTWVYSVRVVTPSNASQMLLHLLENEVDSFQTIEEYVGTPLEWSAYFDETDHEYIRFPGTWAVVDSAPGAPTSIRGENAELRLEALDMLVDSEAAATEYVEGLRSGIEVQSVEPVEQFGTAGFKVSYTLSTLDGASQSGLVTILNEDEQSHVANLLLTNVSDTNLNEVDVEAEDTTQQVKEAIALLQTFSIRPDLDTSSAESE